ncbi:4962_t:CDS:10 [Funneliformis caledonium]|uniref:Ribosome biogenesis protein YTM1 n=1 Tax=Funneliformis caledonium TaxID=1117310 RepID=A0A9N9DGL1_9GLOM|nr:4962_t:CDS:10 [Funneliformis caledonium]
METSQEVQVRFVTKQPEFAVTDTPILVPAKLKRYGLSEIINHLLGFEKPVPFDFMIDNLFLRTSLLEYLENSGLSTENIITVEYVESMLPPTPLSSYQHDDWISSVKSYNQRYFLTGSYDNYARIWNASGECLQTFMGHNAPIKNDDELSFLSASQDRTIRAWKSSFEHNKYISLYECVGHKDSVESVSVSPSGSEFASGSWDSSIMLWTMEIPEDSDDDEHIKIQSSSKRRKVNKKEKIRTKYPIATMNGHVGAVSSVTFDHKDNNKLYSGGWDHTIRIWDVEARTNIDTKNCDKVVYGISYSKKSGLIASGHSDRVIRIWDPRATDTAIVKLTLSSHKNWVTSISWSTTNSFMLASGSYDGTIKIWDIRSKTPLYTLSKQQSDDKGKEKENIKIKKVFSVDWDNDVILSGGEDNQLHIYGTKKIVTSRLFISDITNIQGYGIQGYDKAQRFPLLWTILVGIMTSNLKYRAIILGLGGVSWWDYPLETVYSYVPNFSEARETRYKKWKSRTILGSVRNLEDLFRATGFTCYKGLVVPSEETYILHIHASYNNTLVTLTNSRGDILLTKSGGSVGFKKAQRGGYEAAHQTAAGVIQKIKEKGLNVKNVEICIKGFGPGRDAAFKALANVENQWNVKRITDTTPLPFNGCRPRKARRL